MKGLENIVIGTLAICAVLVTGLLIRRELLGGAVAETAALPQAHVEDWRLYAAAGQRVGPPASKVTIVVFSDYQCPFCRRLEGALQRVRADRPGDVALVYRHFPLESIHPNAYRAALAAECAAEANRFMAMHTLLYAVADSLGSIPWSELANRAGIPDSRGFTGCLRERRYASRITSDVTAAGRLGVRSTPTFLINDRRIRGAISFHSLDSLVASVLTD